MEYIIIDRSGYIPELKISVQKGQCFKVGHPYAKALLPYSTTPHLLEELALQSSESSGKLQEAPEKPQKATEAPGMTLLAPESTESSSLPPESSKSSILSPEAPESSGKKVSLSKKEEEDLRKMARDAGFKQWKKMKVETLIKKMEEL